MVLVYRYNFFTFGHAVRELSASRGSREGNNAFLEVRRVTLNKYSNQIVMPLVSFNFPIAIDG